MEVIKNNDNGLLINDFGVQENGIHFWWGSWYAKLMGYKSLKTLMPTIKKARKVCMQLDIPDEINFIETAGPEGKDFKLTKFACFLIALQADGRKPIVKQARTYFLNELEELNVQFKGQDYLNRMNARDQLKKLNIDFAKAARAAHVKDFQFFVNEGYMGMYNGTNAEIKLKRGIPAKSAMSDYMSITEMAANIFRITLTTERLRLLRNPSEQKAARAHWNIGSQIRSMVMSNTGSYPEKLKTKNNLNLLQKNLKEAHDSLNEVISNQLLSKDSESKEVL